MANFGIANDASFKTVTCGSLNITGDTNLIRRASFSIEGAKTLTPVNCPDFLANPFVPVGGEAATNTYAIWQRHQNVWLAGSAPRQFDVAGAGTIPPSLGVAMVMCMDARVTPYDIWDLNIGECHVIRNAGGVVGKDALRSLIISQELLLTSEIIVAHHLDCGMTKFRGEELTSCLQTKNSTSPTSGGIRPNIFFEDFGGPPTGTDIPPPDGTGTFSDYRAKTLNLSGLNVMENIKRIMLCPFIRFKDRVTGWVYNDCSQTLTAGVLAASGVTNRTTDVVAGELVRIDTSGVLECIKALDDTRPPTDLCGQSGVTLPDPLSACG